MPKIFYYIGTLHSKSRKEDDKQWKGVQIIYSLMEVLMKSGCSSESQGELNSTHQIADNHHSNLHMGDKHNNIPLSFSLFLPHASKLTTESIKLMKSSQSVPLLQSVLSKFSTLFSS